VEGRVAGYLTRVAPHCKSRKALRNQTSNERTSGPGTLGCTTFLLHLPNTTVFECLSFCHLSRLQPDNVSSLQHSTQARINKLFQGFSYTVWRQFGVTRTAFLSRSIFLCWQGRGASSTFPTISIRLVNKNLKPSIRSILYAFCLSVKWHSAPTTINCKPASFQCFDRHFQPHLQCSTQVPSGQSKLVVQPCSLLTNTSQLSYKFAQQ